MLAMKPGAGAMVLKIQLTDFCLAPLRRRRIIGSGM
jgi:hypothetical protein